MTNLSISTHYTLNIKYDSLSNTFVKVLNLLYPKRNMVKLFLLFTVSIIAKMIN